MEKSKDKGGLGFRDIETFNLALKTGVETCSKPELFGGQNCSRKILFPRSFMSSSLGKKPSYAWRSIWQARKLHYEGMIWRVGDGKSIKIREDRWVLAPHTYKIQFVPRKLPREARVSELMDDHTGWWNIPLVQEIFSTEEAERICGMAICPNG